MKKLLWLLLLAAVGRAVGFAPDQRHLAPNVAPFTALGRTSAHGGVGCGVLVGPDLLLTCGHCVSNPQRQLYDDVEVEFGLGFEASTHKARLKEALLQENARADIDAGQDWAIVRLDRPVGLYYGWLKCRYLSDAEWQDAEIELLGYCGCPDEARPQFGRMDRPYRCPGAVSDVGPQIIFHNCAMWGGTSGAPMLARSGDEYTLVGLNFAGVDVEGEKLNHGFRSTYQKELANLAIPARNWREMLSSVVNSPAPVLKNLWVVNRSPLPLAMTIAYHSIFAEPQAPADQLEVQIAPKSRLLVLSRVLGCADSEVMVQLQGRKPQRVRLKSAETTLALP